MGMYAGDAGALGVWLALAVGYALSVRSLVRQRRRAVHVEPRATTKRALELIRRRA